MASLTQSLNHVALGAALLAGGILAYRTITLSSQASASSEFDPGSIIEVVVTGRANVRDKPTANGSLVLYTAERGSQLRGWWVNGDEGQQWLRLQQADGSEAYIWSGNLGNVTPQNPEPSRDEFTITDVTLGKSVTNNRVDNIVTDNTYRSIPSTIVIEFRYSGATPGDEYTCTAGLHGASPMFAQGKFEHPSGTIWCRFDASAPGRYGLAVSYGGNERWNGFAIVVGDPQKIQKVQSGIGNDTPDRERANASQRCTGQTTPSERLICQDPALRSLYSQLGRSWSRAASRFQRAGQRLAPIETFRTRADNCRNSACARRTLSEQIQFLDSLEPTPPTSPVSPRFEVSKTASPKNEPGRWIRSDDYPSQARREGREGVVGVSLRIGVDGNVSTCQVTRSSGAQTLDEATCRLIQRRARFRPATDTSGQSVEGSYSTSVRWVLPD